MRPTLTEQWYTVLPPTEVLRRLGYRTAPSTVYKLAGGFIFQGYRYTYTHYFVGELVADSFMLQRFLPLGGRGRTTGLGNVWQPAVHGRLLAAGSGTRVELRYSLPPLALALFLLSLLAWAGQQLSTVSLGFMLVRLGLVASVFGLVLWGIFRLAVSRLRTRLTDFLLLQTSPITG